MLTFAKFLMRTSFDNTMKKITISLLTLILALACGKSSGLKTMTVSGNIKGLKKGTLYLQHIADSSLVAIDSIEVDGDGNFSFKTEVESAEIFYLYLNKKDNNDVNDRIAFFGEPGAITIETAWNTFDASPEINGSKSHEIWQEYQKTMTRFNKKNLEIMQTSMGNGKTLSDAEIDSLQTLSDRNIQRGYAFAINYALNNVSSPVAPYIALNDVADANVRYLDSISNLMPPDVAGSKYGQKLKKYLAEVKR